MRAQRAADVPLIELDKFFKKIMVWSGATAYGLTDPVVLDANANVNVDAYREQALKVEMKRAFRRRGDRQDLTRTQPFKSIGAGIFKQMG